MWLTVVPLPGIGNSRSGIWRGQYFDEDNDEEYNYGGLLNVKQNRTDEDERER